VGWVAFFTRPASESNMLTSSFCVDLGILLGTVATTVNTLLLPVIDTSAFAATVFAVAFIVVSLRGAPIIGNIVGWFLGLITFFTAHPEPTVIKVISLIVPAFFGASSGYFCTYLQSLPEKVEAN